MVSVVFEEPRQVRHCATRQRAVAVTALQHANEASLCVAFGKCSRITCETMIERGWDFALMSRHSRMFMFTSVEPAAVNSKSVTLESEYSDRTADLIKISTSSVESPVLSRKSPALSRRREYGPA